MKRLTYRLEDQCGNPTDSIILESDYVFMNTPEKLKIISSRLAAIEDILGNEYELDRLRELVEAEKEDRYIIMKELRQAGVHRLTELAEADIEGRCVVLPKDGMVYYIEEAGGEKWIGNKPIQQVVLRCGFGMALLEFSLFDKGKYFSRAEAEAALRREQE